MFCLLLKADHCQFLQLGLRQMHGRKLLCELFDVGLQDLNLPLLGVELRLLCRVFSKIRLGVVDILVQRELALQEIQFLLQVVDLRSGFWRLPAAHIRYATLFVGM